MYAEQNHASLAQIVEDDANRRIEDSITAVMNRTALVLQKRQQFKFKWCVEAARELDRMSPIRRDHLQQARQMLDKRSYEWVEKAHY